VITKWSISLDAATEDTYTRVRGGDWSALLEGLDVIQPWHGDRLQLNFCIQRDNYQEIESFAQLANQYGAFIQYQKLMDWGHQSVEWIKSNNVFNRTTQTFDQVLDRLAKVKAQYPIRVTLPPDLARQLEQAKNTP
jgi:molybdenum cofactor biosynthesis enzyme MoaA